MKGDEDYEYRYASTMMASVSPACSMVSTVDLADFLTNRPNGIVSVRQYGISKRKPKTNRKLLLLEN
jgi:hypothetical protein